MNGLEVLYQAEKFCAFFPRSGCPTLFSAFRWWAWSKDFAPEDRRAIADSVRVRFKVADELARAERAVDREFTVDASQRLDAALVARESER